MKKQNLIFLKVKNLPNRPGSSLLEKGTTDDSVHNLKKKISLSKLLDHCLQLMQDLFDKDQREKDTELHSNTLR